MEKNRINFRGIFKGIIFSVIATILLVIIIALISYFADVSDKLISASLFIVSIISVLTGAILVTRSTQENGLIHGAIIGLGYFVVVLISSIIVKRELDFNTSLITMLIANIAGGMLGGILGINSKWKIPTHLSGYFL